jgi:hypothetical protein
MSKAHGRHAAGAGGLQHASEGKSRARRRPGAVDNRGGKGQVHCLRTSCLIHGARPKGPGKRFKRERCACLLAHEPAAALPHVCRTWN